MAIELVLGDITRVEADAIVNAANAFLTRGGGVCGAIHAAAGPQLIAACAAYVATHGSVKTGGAAMTPGFNLSARYVIHAVGPVWNGGDREEPRFLASAYRSSLSLADEAGLETIAFPSISTGIFGYPVGLAAPVALQAVSDALGSATTLRHATFVLFDAATLATYERALAALA